MLTKLFFSYVYSAFVQWLGWNYTRTFLFNLFMVQYIYLCWQVELNYQLTNLDTLLGSIFCSRFLSIFVCPWLLEVCAITRFNLMDRVEDFWGLFLLKYFFLNITRLSFVSIFSWMPNAFTLFWDKRCFEDIINYVLIFIYFQYCISLKRINFDISFTW